MHSPQTSPEWGAGGGGAGKSGRAGKPGSVDNCTRLAAREEKRGGDGTEGWEFALEEQLQLRAGAWLISAA